MKMCVGLMSATMLILSACAVKPDPEAAGPYPSNYKEILKRHIEESFYDPYSIRSVSISGPQMGHLYFRQGWIVCLEANAKNRLGGYVGLSRDAYLINRGQVVNMMEEAPFCDDLTLSPWPEMEGKN